MVIVRVYAKELVLLITCHTMYIYEVRRREERRRENTFDVLQFENYDTFTCYLIVNVQYDPIWP